MDAKYSLALAGLGLPASSSSGINHLGTYARY